MGCIAGKTSHADTGETESTISTVSYRRKSLPYDDYWTEQEIKEEKEIEAELEGKKTTPRKTKSRNDKVLIPEKVANQVSLNEVKEPKLNSTERQKTKNIEKVRPDEDDNANKIEKDIKAKHIERPSAKERERGNASEPKKDVSTKSIDKVQTEETSKNRKLTEVNDNPRINEKDNGTEIENKKKKGTQDNNNKTKEKNSQQFHADGKDSADGIGIAQDETKDDPESVIDKTVQENKEDEKMGNPESKVDNKLNGHIEMSNEDKEETVEEQADDHHVHWKDDNKVKHGISKTSLKDAEIKLMPTPSERVLSAHVRRGSLKHSAGRRSSLRFTSARRDRRDSAKHSASKERRESKSVDETDTKDISSTEQKMDAEKNSTHDTNENPQTEEEAADNYADVEQMIRDESSKDDDEEDDIDSFNEEELSTSQMTDRAPSLSLWYDDNERGDILTTQVYVPSFGLTRYTYYCCLQWNSGKNGGGYCGLQDHENGRNYIFSIWDPMDGEGKIKPVYIGPGTTCEAFGGEGTGLKSWNFDLGWEPDCWYTLVTRRWDHEGHTRYGFWVKHHLECFWTHMVTVDFPLPGIYYDTWTCSFLEDWEGSGHRVRRAHLRNGFKRKLNSEWVPFDKAVLGTVKEISSRRYRGNFDAGTFDEMFFLQSGGETIPTEGINEGSCFYSVSDDKPTEVPISCVLTTVTGSEMVWEVSEGSVPQFRYAIKIDGELYKQEINSEMRVCKFDSPPEKLVEIFVEDILGRTANAKFVVREKLKVKTKAKSSNR